MCPEKTVIYYSETEARANLLFICRACNCHDELVGACEALDEWDKNPPDDGMMELATIILAVRRILAKAKA